jgi:DNA polymerase III sliding clamp (beta) subunit (PCNA family)
MLSDAFWQKPEADQEAERKAYGKESSFLVNAFFLERILKSFSGDRIELFWTHSTAPITFSESRQRALLMPVQTR